MVAKFFLLIHHILLTFNWKYMSQLPVLFGYQGFYLDWWSMQIVETPNNETKKDYYA